MRRIVLRGRAEPSASYRRLVVPVVDDAETRAALDVACRLASERRASLVAVSVLVVPPALPLDSHMATEEARARELQERAEATAASFGIRAVPRLVRARDAGVAIVEEAMGAGAELIVLGTTRRTLRGSGALVLGDTVRHVLTAATCRVLVVSTKPELEPTAVLRAAVARAVA